jgi:Ca2+-binding RTX toxin-like protein
MRGCSAVDAGPGDDTVIGSMNGDTLRGGDGRDRIQAMSGDDTVDGGAPARSRCGSPA